MTRSVAVVGAGMVGLSTAWFLQEAGADVTVFDREHVAAGSSWGNAGWLTPGLTAPLPEPAVLSYGVKAVVSPSSPVYVPLRPDPRLLRFLAGFARHSTQRRWELGMRAYAPVNRVSLAAFDEMVQGGVDAKTTRATPFLMGFRTAEERTPLLAELEGIRAAGQDMSWDLLTGAEARELEPSLTTAVGAAVRLEDQRFINPPVFVEALAAAVRDRGGRIVESRPIIDVSGQRDAAYLRDDTGEVHAFDDVVLANGAWLGELARKFGVRQLVQGGRGYSFNVACETLPRGPVYFPTQRVACTPLMTGHGPRLRVAGMMEFRAPDAPLDHRRVEAIVEAVRPLFTGVDLDQRRDVWVGSRPCTTDGLPLVGRSSSPRVFVAGGHGMWGVALGPLTGKLLTEQIVTGRAPAELTPFDPLR